jgi:hypothetical protein
MSWPNVMLPRQALLRRVSRDNGKAPGGVCGLRGAAYLILQDEHSAAAEFQKFIDHRGLTGNSMGRARSHCEAAISESGGRLSTV